MSTLATLPETVREEVLSRADLAWLHADEPTNHFVVTSLALFDEPLNVDRFKTMLSQRIELHPRLSQVITTPLNPLAGRRWSAARDFDLAAHIHRTALAAPGGLKALAAYVGRLAGRQLDPGRPLWDVHVVDGPGRGGALVTRFHHALGDGQAMVRMLLSLTDDSAGAWEKPLRRPRRVSGRRRAAPRMPHVPNLPAMVRQGVQAAGTLARLTLFDPDPPTSLRGGLTLLKGVAWSDPLPLIEVKRMAQASGTTVNDVVVSLIAGALGNHLRDRGEDTCGLRIRAMVPVSMRAADDMAMSGNRSSLVYLELPVGVTDARERLMRVKIEMDRIKASLEPAVGWLLVQSLGLLPKPVEQIASAFYARKASLVLTNVIGPAKRIYLAGSPIRQMTFWEPQSGGLGLGVSIYSYAGEITVGVVSDRNLVADPYEITRGVVTELEKLREPGDSW
ncbi:MAG TPA: wax ester/triacylglycerol synthase family O-acyltransferase [Candidatus Dormibacteraeota bacterium]